MSLPQLPQSSPQVLYYHPVLSLTQGISLSPQSPWADHHYFIYTVITIINSYKILSPQWSSSDHYYSVPTLLFSTLLPYLVTLSLQWSSTDHYHLPPSHHTIRRQLKSVNYLLLQVRMGKKRQCQQTFVQPLFPVCCEASGNCCPGRVLMAFLYYANVCYCAIPLVHVNQLL